MNITETNLWKVQYAPRIKILRKSLGADRVKVFDNFGVSRQIEIIDNLQAGGWFK